MKKLMLIVFVLFTNIQSIDAQQSTSEIVSSQGFTIESLLRGLLGMFVLILISYIFASMLIHVVKSKIHRVKVTGAELNYIGSITIDKDLLDAANIVEGEKVQVVNNNNGERLETYAIPGPRGSGEITLNGAAARKVSKGDILILITYAILTQEEAKTFKPSLVFPNQDNLLI